RRGEQHVQLALVVDRAARVQVLVPDLRLERVRLPELERVRRLHVEVAVAEDGRRALRARRRADLADRERLAVPVDDLAFTARGADEVPHPLAGTHDVRRMLRVGADRGDAEELGELVEPRVWHRASLAKRKRCPAPEAPGTDIRTTRRRGASATRRVRGASSAP